MDLLPTQPQVGNAAYQFQPQIKIPFGNTTYQFHTPTDPFVTQVGNAAFQRWFEELVPNTYNHVFSYDPAAAGVFPWKWRPGYLLQVKRAV